MISADGTAVYPWNHGETLTAAALNAAIAQAGSENVPRNALDYGVVNDGVTDTTNAIRAFIQAGGACYFPPGRYLYNGPYSILYSNTKVFGAGPTLSVFVTGTSMGGGHQDPTFGYIFVNNLYDINGASTLTPTSPSVQTDVNIEISDIGFDVTNSVTTNTNIARMLWAKNVRIRNIRADNYSPLTSHPWTGFAFLGCDLYSIENFYARGCVQAIDQWKANTRAKFSNLWIEGCSPGGNGGVINWNAIGTTHADGGITDDLQISNSTIWLNGGIGLYLDTLGGGSKSQNIQLTNLNIVAQTQSASTGHFNSGIIFRGLANRLNVHGCSFSAATGADMQPILMGGYFDPTAQQTSPGGSVTTTSGSTSATITYSCQSGVGNFVSIDGGSTSTPLVGNGVSLLGYYPITAVSGPTSGGSVTGTTLTFTMPTAATASGLIAAATRVFGFYGATSNVNIKGILIDGCWANSGDLIIAHGQGHSIESVLVTRNYQGAASPQYRSVVSIDTTECHGTPSPAVCYVNSIVADQGTGSLPAGFIGDNVVQWNNFGVAPASGTFITAPVGSESTNTASTTAFAARLLGWTTPTMPDANTTFTSASTGGFLVNMVGTLTADRTMTMPVSGYQRNWIIRNGTSGGHNLGVVGTSGSTTWLPPGYTMEFWTDGANINATQNLLPSIRVGDATRNAYTITYGAAPSNPITLAATGTGGIQFNSIVGFNSTAPIAKPTVSGAWAGNTAGKALSTALASLGLITDSTTA